MHVSSDQMINRRQFDTPFIARVSGLIFCAVMMLWATSLSAQTLYEAESGTRNGTANLENSGQYVGNLGNGVDNWVGIRNVNVPTAGSYRITVSYASGDDSRALILRMNGNDSTRITQNVPNTGGWNTTGTINYDVVLQSGINSIRFYNANTSGNTYAPPVDKISVSANPTPVISASGTLATTQIFVRLAATVRPGVSSGNIILSSPGANQRTVAIPTGTVAALGTISYYYLVKSKTRIC
jgi:hypothetical protein